MSCCAVAMIILQCPLRCTRTQDEQCDGCKAMLISLIVELQILECIGHFISCNEQKANFSLQHNESSQALKRGICLDLDVHGWRVGQTTKDKEIFKSLPPHHFLEHERTEERFELNQALCSNFHTKVTKGK